MFSYQWAWWKGIVVEGAGLGAECAGIVQKVGPDVRGLVPGDRCMALASGAFSTIVTTSAKLAVKIPDSLSFLDAASMISIYATVIHSLINTARVEKGQSVLIHSARGGVGIAAIQISRLLEAKIYCTVGSEEKADHLMNTSVIPRSCIFNSRHLTFQRDLLQATNGRGVDVVLNSLSGELLHAGWECVAEFGCMVEIGKRDLIGKGRLALDLFESNRSYFGVDLTRIGAERPAVVSHRSLLNNIVELYNSGSIRPISPITSFGARKVEDAMRFMQKGTHIGKIVVEIPEESEEALTIRPSKQKFSLGRDAAYLLVGGLGGLGQAIAVWMAEAGAGEIVFLSPSAGDTARHAAFVHELKALGCTARMVAGSVVDMAKVMHAISTATMPIRGVMQAAMVLKDTAFPSMTYNDWEVVVRPKVDGTWNLHHAFLSQSIHLDFFMLFSSWSGLVGQWGQANYAAANSFLDSFVQYRKAQGLPAAAIDIGAMEDIGYLSRNTHILEHFQKTSTHVLREEDLLESLQLMIGRTDHDHHLEAFPGSRGSSRFVSKGQIALGLRSTQPLSSPNNRTIWKRDPRMLFYRNLESEDAAVDVSDNEQLKQFMAEVTIDPSILDTEHATTFLATEIGQTLCGLMLRDEESLSLQETPQSLGIDSLVSIELKNWFKHRLGVEVTVIEILGVKTILDLGQLSARLLKAKHVTGSEQDRDGPERNAKYLEMRAP